jgi:hypothetical protein
MKALLHIAGGAIFLLTAIAYSAQKAEATKETPSPVYFGSEFKGEGLYLFRLPDRTSTNLPHMEIVVTNDTLTVGMTVANGYEKDVLLEELNEYHFDLSKYEVYDAEGKLINEGGGGGSAFGWHQSRWVSLYGEKRENWSNELLPSYQSMASVSYKAKIEDFPYLDEKGRPIPNLCFIQDTYRLPRPANADHAILELKLKLSYYVTNQAKHYFTQVPIRIALNFTHGEKKQGKNPPSKGD